jgi:hypothetical protein
MTLLSTMYSTLPAFVLGFHGCDRSIVEAIICGRETLRPSENDYDWLGHGAYFWENDPVRALHFAELLKQHPPRDHDPIHTPAVLGAVIDLGHCLNLMETSALHLVRSTYDLLLDSVTSSAGTMPVNSTPSAAGDLLVRRLDCAVIELIHQSSPTRGEPPFDTVRGLFFEGHPLYPNAGFREKNHIQLCVRNPNCIKGFFVPRQPDPEYPLP